MLNTGRRNLICDAFYSPLTNWKNVVKDKNIEGNGINYVKECIVKVCSGRNIFTLLEHWILDVEDYLLRALVHDEHWPLLWVLAIGPDPVISVSNFCLQIFNRIQPPDRSACPSSALWFMFSSLLAKVLLLHSKQVTQQSQSALLANWPHGWSDEKP